MKNNNSIFIFISFFCFIAVIACKKFVEIAPPGTQVISSTVFQDSTTADAAIIGIYSKMMEANNLPMNGGYSLYTGLSSDELQNTTTNVTYDLFGNNTLSATSTDPSSQFWAVNYSYIYLINSVIEGATASNVLTDSQKGQLIGEAKFLRAFAYFYLTNIYGKVPLVLTSDYRVNNKIQRTSPDTVYQQIVSDLLDAQSLLGTKYITSSSYSTARPRPNKYVATALLARVYLYMKEYAKAEAAATTLINNPLFSLVTDVSKVFLAGSSEAIWQLIPVSTTINTSEGATFVPSKDTILPVFVLRSGLLTSFENIDQRKTYWTKTNIVKISGVPTNFTYPYKYKIRSGGTPYGEYNIVFRLSEQFLIRAEARARQSSITTALTDLNQVRNRAGLNPASTGSVDSLLNMIEHENQVEFFAEWGHRWLDLKRLGHADSVLAPLKGNNWQSYDVLYPVPYGDLLNNPFMTQNLGYE
jgi:hypothetical protein